MRGESIPQDWAALIYGFLMGAIDASSGMCHSFISNQVDGCPEFRVGGCLGFGGKFWNSNGRWYLSCYREDETPARRQVIDKANKQLAALKAEYDKAKGT